MRAGTLGLVLAFSACRTRIDPEPQSATVADAGCLQTDTSEFVVASYQLFPNAFPVGLGFADVDGDQRQDLIVIAENWKDGEDPQEPRIGVMFRDPDGTFSAITRWTSYSRTGLAGWSTAGFSVGDIDRDGLSDVVACDGAGYTVLRSTQNRDFEPAGYSTLDGALYPLLFDFDADANLDLAVSFADGFKEGIMWAKGDGRFHLTTQQTVITTNRPSAPFVFEGASAASPAQIGAFTDSTVRLLLLQPNATATNAEPTIVNLSFDGASSPINMFHADGTGSHPILAIGYRKAQSYLVSIERSEDGTIGSTLLAQLPFQTSTILPYDARDDTVILKAETRVAIMRSRPNRQVHDIYNSSSGIPQQVAVGTTGGGRARAEVAIATINGTILVLSPPCGK